MASKPNILFFHVDNLGMGELGCYGGGILRGADTKRMDAFAKQGVKLTTLRRRTAVHADSLGADDGTVPDPLGQPHHRARRQRRRHRQVGTHHRPTSVGSRLRDLELRQVAHRRRRRPLPDRPRVRRMVRPSRTYDECMWPDRPALRGGARRLLAHARGRQGQGCMAAQGRAAHHGDQEDLRPRVPEARHQVHGKVCQGGQAVLPATSTTR